MNQSLAYEVSAVMPAAAVTGLQDSLATFQTLSNVVDSSGQVDLTNWVNVAGLVNIPCQLAVMSVMRPNQGATVRGETGFDISGQRILELNGYYSASDIRTGKDFRVIVDSQIYEVMEVTFDSQKQLTRCAVRFWQK